MGFGILDLGFGIWDLGFERTGRRLLGSCGVVKDKLEGVDVERREMRVAPCLDRGRGQREVPRTLQRLPRPL